MPGSNLPPLVPELTIGDPEDIAALAKQAPARPLNDTFVESLRKQHPQDERWSTFRSSNQYVYVMSWMYQCRTYAKLGNEWFDTDLFEVELFNLTHPQPIDDMNLLVNRVRHHLLLRIHGKKLASLALFDPLFRMYFGSDTPMGGPVGDDEDFALPKYRGFDSLYIDEKIDILYRLMTECAYYADFRDHLERSKAEPDLLRPFCIFQQHDKKTATTEEYLFLYEGTALYKRIITYPELVVPHKRSESAPYPETAYPAEAFDVESVRYELIFRDVFGLDAYVRELKEHPKLKKNRALLEVLQHPENVAHVYSCELRKRRFLANRRRDYEVRQVLAVRKRSTRIEAKERQVEEEQRQEKVKQLDQEDIRVAARRRSTRLLRSAERAAYTQADAMEEEDEDEDATDGGEEEVEAANGTDEAIEEDTEASKDAAGASKSESDSSSDATKTQEASLDESGEVSAASLKTIKIALPEAGDIDSMDVDPAYVDEPTGNEHQL